MPTEMAAKVAAPFWPSRPMGNLSWKADVLHVVCFTPELSSDPPPFLSNLTNVYLA